MLYVKKYKISRFFFIKIIGFFQHFGVLFYELNTEKP